jgi:hypothetical protein
MDMHSAVLQVSPTKRAVLNCWVEVYLGDLTQAGTQKLGQITEEVNALVE